MKSVVVTGASTGIGWGTVKVLVANGFRVFGSVRKPEDSAKLAAEFGAAFVPLVFDVTDRAAIAAGAAKVAEALDGETLFGLVNNAGIAMAGLLVYMTPEEIGEQLAVNVQGPLNVTQAFLPLLGTDKSRKGKPGRIVMMSSVGGTSATPFMGAYNTSKFALEGMSEALRRELMLFGIDVLVVAPGPIRTPIWTKSRALTDPRYTQGPYAKVLQKMLLLLKEKVGESLEPEAVGEIVLTALTAAHPKTRAVNAGPSIPFAYTDWGAALLQQGRPDAAIARFTIANQKGPHFADPLEMWGEALMAQNRSDLALPKFEEADKYAPNWGGLHLKWGEALGYAGKADEAKRQFARAAALDLTPAEKSELAKVRTHG